MDFGDSKMRVDLVGGKKVVDDDMPLDEEDEDWGDVPESAGRNVDDENDNDVEFQDATPSANADVSFLRTETDQDASYLGDVAGEETPSAFTGGVGAGTTSAFFGE